MRVFAMEDLAKNWSVKTANTKIRTKWVDGTDLHKLRAIITEGLTIDIGSLLPEPRKSENRGSEAGILSLMEECNEVNDQEFLDALDLSVYFYVNAHSGWQKKVIKGVKVEVIRKNLLELDISIDVLSTK